jgi:thioredoxin reductase
MADQLNDLGRAASSGSACDVVIIGGGPGGLSAALALGRARKRVLLCDSGPRRNAAAKEIHNFVTRDGTPPEEFRASGRQQLAAYPSVAVRDERVQSIAGTRGAFRVALETEVVEARRVLLCTGMIDELLPLEGFRELWGSAIFQCPYCHGWEARERRWGYLARELDPRHFPAFPIMLRGWTRDVVVFTNGAEVSREARESLRAAGVALETRPVVRLRRRDEQLEAVELEAVELEAVELEAVELEAVELEDGTTVACEVLFAQPPQRQVELVRALGVALDDDGYVRVDPMTRETSMPGVYAAGDLTTRMQGAVLAAAAGMHAAAVMNMELTLELAAKGAL